MSQISNFDAQRQEFLKFPDFSGLQSQKMPYRLVMSNNKPVRDVDAPTSQPVEREYLEDADAFCPSRIEPLARAQFEAILSWAKRKATGEFDQFEKIQSEGVPVGMQAGSEDEFCRLGKGVQELHRVGAGCGVYREHGARGRSPCTRLRRRCAIRTQTRQKSALRVRARLFDLSAFMIPVEPRPISGSFHAVFSSL